MASSKEEEEPRYYGMELGVVVDTDDPEGLGRVRLIVHGIIDQPSPWAPQIGTGAGGGPQRGTFAVPPKGSDVAVWFHRGNPQRPYYQGGHYGKPAAGEEVPTDVKAVDVKDRPLISSQETEHWILTFDDRPDKQKMQVRHKLLDLMIDLDGVKGVAELTGEASVSIVSNGFIRLKAPVIQLGDRVVLQNGKPIS